MNEAVQIAHLRLLLAVLNHDAIEAHRIIDAADLVSLAHFQADRIALILCGSPGEVIEGEPHEEMVRRIRDDIEHDLRVLEAEA